MGVKIEKDKKCNVMGCDLSYNHSGMHHVILSSTRRKKLFCPVVNTKFATMRKSPSKHRSDQKIDKCDIQIELIKSRLLFLKKTIDELIDIL